MGITTVSETVTRPVRRALRAGIAVLGLSALTPSSPAHAQGLPLIRDTEIENVLKDYARPIFKAANVSAQNISMRIIRADSFNAFVADGHNVFVNTGTLTQAKTPNEVIGVIAHETGHITGGHLAALRARIARDQTKALLVGILGIGAMVAGATSKTENGRELGGLGQGVMFGGNAVITRGILSERRSQEAAADQAGLGFLAATQQSGRGMLEVFERFRQQEYISEQQMDPFMRSHPVATDRLANLREKVEKSPHFGKPDDPALQLRHDMMRAKIAGFLESPRAIANSYPANDRSLPARYARAIAANCSGHCDSAIGQIDALIAEQPQNAYFHELRGDMLFAGGKPREAVVSLRKAVQLMPNYSPMMEVNLAQAMLGTDDPTLLDDALARLRKASVNEEDNSTAFHLMATAYNKKKQEPLAMLATARAHFIEGNFKQALIFAKRAQVGLKQGTPEWIRAEDIITYKPPQQG
jgi:predicted Zn-dependent protease